MKQDRSKSSEWWRSTACHMWRTYFALEREGFNWDELSMPNRRIYAVCHHVFLKKFVSADQDILRTYFASRWGDDIYTVENYSAKHNVPVKVIWMVIRRANRTIMEETGFLERKENESDDE